MANPAHNETACKDADCGLFTLAKSAEVMASSVTAYKASMSPRCYRAIPEGATAPRRGIFNADRGRAAGPER